MSSLQDYSFRVRISMGSHPWLQHVATSWLIVAFRSAKVALIRPHAKATRRKELAVISLRLRASA